MDDEAVVTHAVELLFLHALLLSHQPLGAKEHALLPAAMLGLIDLGSLHGTKKRVIQ